MEDEEQVEEAQKSKVKKYFEFSNFLVLFFIEYSIKIKKVLSMKQGAFLFLES